MTNSMEQTEVIVGSTPQVFMFIPLFGAVIVLGFAIWHVVKCRLEGERIGVGSLVWAGFITAILIFLAVWCNNQLLDADPLYLIQTVVVLTITGSMLARREYIFRTLDKLDSTNSFQHSVAEVIRVLRDPALILLGSEMARRALEAPWNDTVNDISAENITIEFALIAIAAFIAYFVAQRRSFGPALVFTACAAVGVIEFFILEFRRSPILPMDVLALQTATEVSNQYVFMISTNAIKAFLYGGLALLCASFIRPARVTNYRRVILDVCINVPLALIFALSLSWWIDVPNYREDYGLDILYWNAVKSYKAQGFLPSFLTAVADLPVETPEGYTEELAQQTTETYTKAADAMPERSTRRAASTAQFEEIKPSIIIVMNETFADLSRLDKLHCGYEGPKFYQTGFDDALVRGQLGMSVYGAGTCNSEFECLTATSTAFVGSGKYPYQMFSFENVPNLARQLSGVGYHTSAIHPNDKDNWNRRVTYGDMGFDEFYNTNNSFEDAPQFHSGITDKATYEKILEILNSSEDPQFIFDVTMQNHGGYSTNNIPPDRMTNYVFPDIDPDNTHQLNEYLSCIQASDEDLEWFVGQLRELERPVVLAFFGDHHPKMSNVPNDLYFPGEDELTHQARVYETEYVIWSNYEVAGTPTGVIDDCGADLLGTRTLDLVGAPLDSFESAQIAAHQRLQIISGIGYQGTDGRWHVPGTAPYLDATYRDMAMMSHLRFGHLFAESSS